MPKTYGSFIPGGKHNLDNILTKKDELPKTLSPSEMILGTPKIDDTHATLKSGSYVYCNI